MVDWGLADNPCIPTALVNDKYFPLLGSDPTLTAGPNRGSWSYNHQAKPPSALTAKAVTVTSWSKKVVAMDMKMAGGMGTATSDASSETAIAT